MRDALFQDLRYAIRGLLSNPAFALVAILSIAIGIGANTVIFSVLNALLLRPLPYPDAERLVILWNRSPGLNIAEDWFSTAQYFDIQSGPNGFEQVAIAIGSNQNLTGPFEPERIGVIRVSSNLLPMLGARAALGRLFLTAEDAPGRPPTVLLSHGTWTRRYGADPGILGRTVTLNGTPYEVAGILPAAFSLPREVLPTLGTAEDGEMFLPLPLGEAAVSDRGHEDYNIIARLKPGVSVGEARVEMDAITRRLRADHPAVYPPNGGLTFGVVPLLDQVVGNVRGTLILLAGSVAFVLLIACANVANLLLSRALAREKEMAMRVAVGASGRRLVFQLLVESLLLAFVGGSLGVVLSITAVRWIHVIQPRNIPRLGSIAVNAEVLLFTFVLCAMAGVLFGLAPALGARRVDPAASLVGAGRGSSAASPVFGRGHGLRRALVIAEIALSLVLLAGSGLLVRSFLGLQSVSPGFDPRGVLTLELTMAGPKYADVLTVRNAYRDLWQRIDGLPGVVASGGVSSLPLSGYFSWGPITIDGRTPPAGEKFINADQRVTGGRYFEALGIPLLKGRLFNEGDTAEKDRVIVIDEFMAREYWPDQDPLGKRVRFGDINSTAPWRTVVGVVGRVKQYGLESEGRIALYIPQTQSGGRAMYVTVRTAADPLALAGSVTREIHAIDPDLPVSRVRSMSALVDQSLARPRFAMALLTLFAGLALVLASIGLYGVMSSLVGQGTREIGIRIALGATPRSVVSLVLGRGLRLTITGASIGLCLTLAATRFMGSLLFGVGATDPVSLLLALVLLASITLIATLIPARRAARNDPAESLRME